MQTFNGSKEVKKSCLLGQKGERGKRCSRLFKRNYYDRAASFLVFEGNRAYDSEFGFPLPLIESYNIIYDGMPGVLARPWLPRIVRNTPVGIDAWQIWSQFVQFFLAEDEGNHFSIVKRIAEERKSEDEQVKHAAELQRDAIAFVAGLYKEGCLDMAVWKRAHEQAAQAVDIAHNAMKAKPKKRNAKQLVPAEAACYAAVVCLPTLANAIYAELFSIVVAEHAASNRYQCQRGYVIQAQKYVELLKAASEQ